MDASSFRPTGGNWQIVGGVTADLDQPSPLETTPGTGIIVNAAGAGQGEHLFTAWEHGDLELELDFMLPQSSNSGIYLQGRYEIQLFDSWGVQQPTSSDAGGVYQRWDERRGAGNEGYGGTPPLQNAIRAPGLWNHLRILFEAPHFDAAGRKTENARFKLVELNGVVIHENVEVTGPTRAAAFEEERPTGPLMIQGDHGPVAFRNIRHRRYGPERVTLSDVRYEVYEGDLKTIDAFLATEPVREGTVGGFDWRLGGHDKFAVTFRGTMHVPATGTYLFGVNLGWIDGDPHFAGTITGGGRLTVGGETVFSREAVDQVGGNRVTGTVSLEHGTHPFTLTYFKNRSWTHSLAEFFVEGSDVPYHVLNTPASVVQPPGGGSKIVHPGQEPALLRGFVWHGDEKRVNAMSVGDPGGVNYAVDLDRAALLYVWRGPFVDTTPMWSGRGTDQVALPLGSVVSFSGAPSFAVLPNASSPWPDSVSAGDYQLQGYSLRDARRPTFRYTVQGATVTDRLVPEARNDGQVLTRYLELSGAGRDDLWMRLAAGEDIVERGDGLYTVDEAYYIDVHESAGATPVIRTQGDRKELLVRIPSQPAETAITYSVIW